MGPSRQLPVRANLEHLRNEAKQRLKALRVQDAATRLTDAQLLIAREYGFASWRRLKAAVDDRDRERVFIAARDGDVEAVRRALEGASIPARPTQPAAPFIRSPRPSPRAPRAPHARVSGARRPARRGQASRQGHPGCRGRRARRRARRLLEAHPICSTRAASISRSRPRCTSGVEQSGRVRAPAAGARRDVRIRDYGDNAYACTSPRQTPTSRSSDARRGRLRRRRRGRRPSRQRARMGDVPRPRARRRRRVSAERGCRAEHLVRHRARSRRRRPRFVRNDPAILSARMSRNEHRRTPLHTRRR